MSSFIQQEITENIGIIRLHRPEVFNSFNRAMALQLQDVLRQYSADDSVRAIYLTGSGKAFCAGQDLAELTTESAPSIEQIVREHYNPIIKHIREASKPVVCAVNGVAAGAGANLALACDITVARETAAFVQAFSKIGLIPDSGGTYFLPKLIGFQKASALMMLGEKIMATEAERLGMIYQALPAEGFEEQSFSLAQKVSKMPTQGLVLTKQLLNAGVHHDLNQQLDMEEKYQSAAGQTEDYQEGIQAFLEKRKPHFKGK